MSICYGSLPSALQLDPCKVAAFKAVDQHLGCGNVGGNGDRVHVTQAQQHHIIRLAGFGADRIAEKEQHVNLTAACLLYTSTEQGYTVYICDQDKNLTEKRDYTAAVSYTHPLRRWPGRTAR